MMGKTQKFSKGYSSGFVSDYRHAVDNMAESEGLGSSGRMDTEMTASEGSSAPKRKCISLNVDSYNSFGIPTEIYSVTKMSRSERKQLEMRLKVELDQVQKLRRKITMQFSNVVPVSSSSCGEVKKGNFTQNMHRSMEFSSKQVNRKVPLGRSSQSLKRGLLGRFESVNQEMPPSVTDPKLMEQCEALLKRVMSHEYSWVFNKPVDIVKLNIPDYFTVIKTPMDLGTVKSKITSGQYSSPWEFLADVRLTFTNAMTYNPPTNDVHIMAKTLSKYFEQRWKNIQKKLPPIDSVPVTARTSVSRESKVPKANSPSKKRKISSIDLGVKREPVKKEPVKKESIKKDLVKQRVMTEEEKRNLSKDMESIQEELPNHIVDFLLKEQNAAEGQTPGGEEITVDIDVFSDKTLFTLRRLLDEHLQEKQRNCAKTEACDMEQLNESGLSNSSIQPCKGNDPVEEDVDIGGNDPPVSSYPPVEIEKDTANRSSKCSSSSSSSSGSSSSSSDSDTGSSSSSDEDVAKTSSPANRTKETQTNNHGDSHDKKQSVSGLDQLERNRQMKPSSFEAESRHSEEDVPCERQVSPDKRYRAALLRNRFADTILKAQEKTLDQGEKGDPEKLRREREELERKQREEKARLQAEAEAAENARRQAEAEAAAEAKRKRELDRKAARQALQEMEKTVEIDENCHFLEDLEMLRCAASAPHLPLAEVTSPDQSSDGIVGGFTLQGSNPLEQLGLFMKVDDEEEEEEEENVEPSYVPKPKTDVEEGEID